MKVTDIYSDLRRKSLKDSHFFGRKIYLVKSSDFKAYTDHFFDAPNILNDKRNYRTKGKFRHIHAIESNSFVEFHYDFGNLYEFAPMAVPHLFFDVIPYFLYHFITMKKPYMVHEELEEAREELIV